ncbi:MAG TPA: aminotransferase class V-fold PLP-dependent enzyme [Candidatus Poseidoniales archaeon]|nr:MAG TPA: aminotransferase class V-fold PLP-dependent enzyme [Candidatus Poseidoniales archaeon]
MDMPSHLAKHWTFDPSRVFLNHGSFGACPDFIIEEQRMWQDLMEKEPVQFFEELMPDLLTKSRTALGEFLSCDANDLAFVSNATSGVNTILRSLHFKQGDEILVPNHAYQACRNTIDFVASRWGAKVVEVAIPFPIDGPQVVIELMKSACSERTKLVMIDTVTSPTGLRMPFEELTEFFEGRGVEVLLDAAHGIGMIPLNLEKLGASYVTSNCHKWLCAPKGSAFLYVRSDKQNKIQPLTISHGHTFPLGETTRFRHEFDWTGTQDISGWCAIPAVIEGMAKLIDGGWETIMQHNHDLAIQGRDILCKRLGIEQPCPDEMIACISTIQLPGEIPAKEKMYEPDPLHHLLSKKYNIQVPVWSWPSPEGRYLRISAQLYNSIEQYELLADALVNELK